ncbi:thiamine-triphosphatase [Parastagonospora nodorum]|uniref:Thiamine-triphosphatase n=2 Tax=Phaeosphaeria nodorum (strain SN15 / ATCC MYA-4574 / FGSC 10173) TaxID=321614 RepID=A0A7U2HWA5_PHANO|nr:hypothetical protein SNOG_07908 [Parastagonospora nodorum SN15]KAH3917478.1 thiamine-triphosphatase [Parastagonospora nodorum]EAT84184.1 hypothetical protein SNOG_07908 [Parastagonospora nodorum SN15]KAH3933435.1 thiamine-triphosphatase [Parastagonospora nodorum]KAH3943424.1 thiamine-triphosphatase [Parastagonospora nodorum]KAH3961859.1 thiamine-triphosphatase [Parastagonospora nodorum]
MARSLPALSCILEVERKFRSLAVQELTAHQGSPSFRSVRSLGQRTLHDVYYDQSSLLSSAGVWVRQRNGQWEAKIKMGGDFTNSKFEEITGHRDISRCVKEIIGGKCIEEGRQFGLVQTAAFVTTRKAWIADDEFQIVLDTTDFGHTVGEVELQQQVSLTREREMCLEQERQRILQKMDDRIAAFMTHYAWAFCPGAPKGKLTAYFERETYQSMSESTRRPSKP